MNNKRLISLTVCLILVTVPGTSSLVLADIASETDTKAQQHFEKANELRKVADYDTAITEYKKVISLSPNSKIAQDAQYWIGQSYFEAGQFDAALSAFQKLLDEYPTSTIIPSTKLMMERVQQAKKNKSLFEAVKKADVEQVRLLIAEGADINAAGGDKALTPLHLAASIGHTEVVKALLEKGAEVNVGDADGNTALYWAIGSQDEETVKSLIDGGIDVNKGAEDVHPLNLAIWNLSKGIVEALLNAGANTDVKDSGGYTPLFYAAFFNTYDRDREMLELFLDRTEQPNTIHMAAYKGDLEAVKTFISNGVDVNVKDSSGCMPLHWAVLQDSPAVAEYLIAQGAEINEKVGNFLTPLFCANALPVIELLVSKGADINTKRQNRLHKACRMGDKEVAEFLISKGADVNAKGSAGKTPLIYALQRGHTDVARLLIAKGAEVNAADSQGCTPISIANNNGYAEIVNLLLQHGEKERLQMAVTVGNLEELKRLLANGYNINAYDSGHRAPLHVAAREGHMVIVEYLIEEGADSNYRGPNGNSPMCFAAYAGHLDIVKKLHAQGADISLTNTGNYSALHMAAIKGHTDIVKFLVANGADINRKSIKGETPLTLAKSKNHREVVQFLEEHGAKE